ncbi:hypothetical protein HK100_006855 [Physocladia obscura]|uniref:Uncharacterized protein n=1 Tax=Physocladia obscura TaxID=109957 RepID=A0AAD5TC17_9FUNG|nr:hypothetical protein HK100_006855 [Physocladia obscura]
MRGQGTKSDIDDSEQGWQNELHPSSSHLLIFATIFYGFGIAIGVFGSPAVVAATLVAFDIVRNKRRENRERASVLSQDSITPPMCDESTQTKFQAEQTTSLISHKTSLLSLTKTSNENCKSYDILKRELLFSDKSFLTKSQHLAAAGIHYVAKSCFEPELTATTGYEEIIPGLTAADVVAFVDAIKYLVLMEGGGVYIAEEQFQSIKASANIVVNLAFKDIEHDADTLRQSAFCLSKLPNLLVNIQIIKHHACDQTKFGDDEFFDVAIAKDCISTCLTRVFELLHGKESIDLDDQIDAIKHYWIRERVCSIFVHTLGSNLQESKSEVFQLLHQLKDLEELSDLSDESSSENDDNDLSFYVGKRVVDNDDETLVSKRSSAWTSVFDQVNQISSKIPKTYLVYTSSVDTFSVTCPESPTLRTAIAQMPATGLTPGDIFLVLCTWHEPISGSSATNSVSDTLLSRRPKSNFIPTPSSLDKFATISYSKTTDNQQSGFEKALYARLESILDLGSGVSQMVVEVIDERDDVAFQFGIGNEVDVSRLVVENRVRDSLRFGAVRIDEDVFNAFFSK